MDVKQKFIDLLSEYGISIAGRVERDIFSEEFLRKQPTQPFIDFSGVEMLEDRIQFWYDMPGGMGRIKVERPWSQFHISFIEMDECETT